jgi:hypothetical protein
MPNYGTRIDDESRVLDERSRQIRDRILGGYCTRDQLCLAMGWTMNAYYIYSARGLPHVRVGRNRLHDPDAIREWMIQRGAHKQTIAAAERRKGSPQAEPANPAPRKRGRPRKLVAAE